MSSTCVRYVVKQIVKQIPGTVVNYNKIYTVVNQIDRWCALVDGLLCEISQMGLIVVLSLLYVQVVYQDSNV